ncbi:uncharacterized protein LOC130666538 [Microplitis mediator]|uniref:uncharacterized protein LOC130666538 n=1 Tax=Microplitis mediator TaxID=375433 RepID=UPI0025558E50|nr:uncharacterized protein LOC130666538 [Microplitis mediator]
MFILKCQRDNSFCKVEDSEVIFDKENPPNENEIVKFLYNGKEELGEVVMISDNNKQINSKFEEMKKSLKKRPLVSLSPEGNNKSMIPEKRTRKLNSKYSSPSFENLNLLKPLKVDQGEKKRELKDDNKKKSDKLKQSQIEKDIFYNKSKTVETKKKECSPTKEELKKKLTALEEQMKISKKSREKGLLNYGKTRPPDTLALNKNNNAPENENSATDSDSDVSSQKDDLSDLQDSSGNQINLETSKLSSVSDDDKKENSSPNTTFNDLHVNSVTTESHTDSNNDPDLYGKDWSEEPMIKLMNKIYCKKSEYETCKSLCSQATHVVRRLITGVFKPSGYLDATLTGQTPRAHHQEGKVAPVKALNSVAKDEIIDFAIALAKAKKWVTPKGVPHTREQLASAMSQRIGELKRTHLANKKANP